MNLTQKSKKVLNNLILKNGGILATPKNGAYPYVYTRDAVIITRALNRLGQVQDSEKFYYFMKKYSNIENYKEIFQRYNTNGLPAVTRSNQNDNEGLLLYGIYDTYIHSKKETFLENMWSLINQTANLILTYSKSGLVKTSRSIHEYEKLEKGFEIWSSSACCRGLFDASKIAQILGHKEESRIWKERAEVIRKNISTKMVNKKTGLFVKNTRYPDSPDMSQLAPFYFEIYDNKTKLKKTLEYLKKHLWEEDIGGFRRFRKFEICDDWHWYSGGSGSWVWLTLIAARFYKQLNMKNEYDNCIKWVNSISKEANGMLPEHIATKEEYDEWKGKEIEFNTRIINEMKIVEKSKVKIKNKQMMYWATPLGWSHAEYILLMKK